MSMDETESVAFSFGTTQLDGVGSEDLANDYSEGTFSDVVDSMHEESPSQSSAIEDDNVSSDGPSVDRSVLGWEMVDGKVGIAFFPDLIVYRNLKWNFTDFKVIFFYNCVHASGSTAQGRLCIELSVEDVVDIRSQRCGRTETIEVKINVIATGCPQVGNLDSTSGVEELRFCVVDSLWHEKVEEIMSLNVKYKALWNLMLDTEGEMDMEDFLSRNTLPLPKKFIPKFVENFEVIYPEGDPDAVSISMRDVDMLKPDTFINDTIIDFYIKYLKNTMILPEEKPRFHFFNCFFFRKLADLDKDPSSAFEGRAAFSRVRKWTRKIDLFSKDFIFIPVNYSLHWSLIVICHPGEIAKISGDDAENLARVPCILHMDSLKGSHANLKDLIQSYLWEEWKERQMGTDEAISSRFLNLRFVPLELPQQQNYFDCGLFLLHYLESFLEARLANFSPFMVKKSKIPHFLTSKWFLPDEPYLKRSAIARLVHGLVNKHHFSGSSVQHCPSNNPKSNYDNEKDLEVVGAGLSLSMDVSNQYVPIFNGGPGIEMDLLHASSFESAQGVISGSGLRLREFFDPMSSAKLVLDVKHQTLGRTSSISGHGSDLPSIELEEVEADLQFAQTSTEPGFQHIVANDLEASALLYQSENYSNQRFSQEEHENSHSFLTSNSGGPTVTEKIPLGVASLDDHMDHPNNESAGNTESSTKPEPASLDDHTDRPNHESALNTESYTKCEASSLYDYMDHPNHESALNTESSTRPEAFSLDDRMDLPNHEFAINTESSTIPEASSLDDHMDLPNHESVLNLESSTKPEPSSLDDHIDHPNHESAGNTENSRKRDCPSGVTEGDSDSMYPTMIDHNDSADHQFPFLNNLPELSLLSNENCAQEGGGITDGQMIADVLKSQHHPPTKKIQLMFSLDMENSATTLSEDLHL